MQGADVVWKIITRGSDAVVATGALGLLAGWGAYEWVAAQTNYYDAPLICGASAVGVPVALAGGAYAARRGVRAARNADWGVLLRRPAAPDPAGDDPARAWINAVAGLHRARQPVYPLGRDVESDALVHLDLRRVHHLIVNGQTGSGKTMRVLRPLAAMAAVSGLFQVIILDRSGRNFRVIAPHPNVHVVRYDHLELPEMLESVYAEIERRDRWLAAQPEQPTTVARARADRRPPRVLLIVDEFSNVSRLLKTKDRTAYGRLTSAAIQIAQEGRGMSVHLVLAAQRPDHNSVNTTLRSQLDALTFHMRDATDARLADAPGAETLEEGEAVFSTPAGYRRLAVFKPGDAQLRHFISAAPAAAIEPPIWLAGYDPAGPSGTSRRPAAPVQPNEAAVQGEIGAVQGAGEAVLPSEAAVSRTDPPASRTGSGGGSAWDLGSNPGPVPVEAAENRADEPVQAVQATQTALADRVREMLRDETPSPAPDLTTGQAQAIALCLMSGQSLSATCRLVFGSKNGRTFDLVKDVQARLAGVLGAAA
jgi:hypothetical protein